MLMERQRQVQRPVAPGGGGGGPEDNDLDEVRADVDGILDAADRILDSIRPLNAEDYLQQNRQRGGQ
jgi:hypothetical protein